MNRRMILAVGLMTALTVLSGCGGAPKTPVPSGGTSNTAAPSSPAQAPAKKDTVVYGSTAEVSGIDPHWRFSLQDLITLRAVYEPLLNVNKQGKFEGVLAESWSVSADQKTWTFKLRQGVKFADGKPFTGKAVKATLDRVLNGKKLGFNFLFGKVTAVEAPDDSTVIIKTKEVDGPLLYNLSTLYITPEDIADPKYLENPYEGKVGTGPFTIVEFKKGSGVTMQKNPHYWRSGLPKTEKLVIRPIPDEPAKIAAFRSGDVQIVDGLSPDGLKTLQSDYTVLPEPVWQTEFLHLNTTRPPLNNPKVRQAINLAINRDMIAKDVIGIGAPNAVYPPKGLVGYNDKFAPNPYDLTKAKVLMKEAFPNGYNGPTLKLMSSPTYVKTEEVLQVITEQLKEIGLKVEPQLVDAAARADMTSSGNFDMAYLGSIAVTGDPARYLLERLVTDAYKTGYRNQAAFDAIVGAAKEIDPAKQDALYKKAQDLMWEEAPIVYVYQDVWITAVAKNLTGYVPMPHRLVDWATVGYGG
jgi:peptide/nickel transport system substrate-binding protein